MMKKATVSKTYMFFVDDINKMQDNGWTPKELLRLGIFAKDDNPQMMKRLTEQEEKMRNIIAALEKTSARAFKTQSILEAFMGDTLDNLILKDRQK